jgi:hypothetical protein
MKRKEGRKVNQFIINQFARSLIHMYTHPSIHPCQPANLPTCLSQIKIRIKTQTQTQTQTNPTKSHSTTPHSTTPHSIHPPQHTYLPTTTATKLQPPYHSIS